MDDNYKIYQQLLNHFKSNKFENLYQTFKRITDTNVLFLIIVDYNLLNNHALVPIINKEDVFETLSNLYKINEEDLEKLLFQYDIIVE